MGLTAIKYKQTEVGLIPEDWNLVPFNKVFAFQSTSNYSKAQMSYDGEVGCIHYGLIHAISNTQYNLKNGINYYVSYDQAQYDIVRDGDVIMVDASEDIEGVNKSVEVCGIGNKKYISGLHTYLLRDRNKYLADNFRGILLNSQLVKNQMLQLAVGMKVFGVSKTQLIKIKLPLPPTINEQKAIAKVLTDTDSLIQALEKKIAKKKLIKKGVIQKLLEPKKGWITKKLYEIGEITGAGVNKKINEMEYKVKLLNYMDVFKQDYLYQKIFNHVVTAPISKHSSCNVLKGDVFLTPSSEMRKDIGVSALAMEDMEGIVYSYHVNRLRYAIDIDYKFGLYILKTRNFLNQVETLCEGSGKRYVLSLTKFKELTLTFPEDKHEQKRISDILYSLDNELEKLEQKLSKYKLAKQGMMQKLLTGKIRLV